MYKSNSEQDLRGENRIPISTFDIKITNIPIQKITFVIQIIYFE